MTAPTDPSRERRALVLDAALRTFARFGYQKTSMDDIADEARISRQGLYFLFASKSSLFREATERGVEMDLAAAKDALEAERPISERIVDAFDAWAGRYVGPLRHTTALLDDNPDLLGPIARSGPANFETVLTSALEESALHGEAAAMARTLISLSIGIKHQAAERDEYRARMADSVRLLFVRDEPRDDPGAADPTRRDGSLDDASADVS